MSNDTILERREGDDGTDGASFDGIDRRNQNVTLMRLGIVESILEKHVKHCAKLQMGVLGTALTTLAWVVTHSPEVAGALGRFIARLGGAG